MGASDPRIVFRHVLPNIVSPLIVQASLSIAFAILAEASLSFLGLGVQPPTPTWGFDINQARAYISNGYWWMSFAPGVVILITVLSFNFLGDSVRDLLDPRLRDRSFAGDRRYNRHAKGAIGGPFSLSLECGTVVASTTHGSCDWIARVEQRHRPTARNARYVVLVAATIAVAGRGWDGHGFLRPEYRQSVYLPSRILTPVVPSRSTTGDDRSTIDSRNCHATDDAGAECNPCRVGIRQRYHPLATRPG